MSMFSHTTRKWLSEMLEDEGDLEAFVCPEGYDEGHAAITLAFITDGLRGKGDYHEIALDHLRDVSGIKARKIDCDLLLYAGISPLYAIALLHSFGRGNHTVEYDFQAMVSVDDVRGMLRIAQTPNNPDRHIAMCLIREGDIWELQIRVLLADGFFWNTDSLFINDYTGADISIFNRDLITETVRLALPGKPLTALVEHPVLNRYPLTIDRLKIDKLECRALISGANDKLDLAQIAALPLPVGTTKTPS